MERLKEPLGLTVIRMLRPMFQALEKRAAEQTDIKLTTAQFGLLFTIKQEKEEVILKDIAAKMGKDKSAILRMVDALEKKELLRRAVDLKDKRKNQLIITKKGDRIISEFYEMELTLSKELLLGLTDDDLNSFYKVVNQIKTRSEKLIEPLNN